MTGKTSYGLTKSAVCWITGEVEFGFGVVWSNAIIRQLYDVAGNAHLNSCFGVAFSYDKKGPKHIWEPETAQERAAAQKEIDALNAAREPELRAQWQLSTGVRRLNLRRQNPRRKLTWKFTEKTGKLVHKSTGGINWYRYSKVILLGKLIPFAKECLKDRPGTIVQEDNAPSHAAESAREIYYLNDIMRLLWPGNSPNLSAIEPAWYKLKRKTTWIPGPPATKIDAKA